MQVSIIISIALSVALVASPALSSAIKGTVATKGGLRSPVEFSPASKGRLAAAPVQPIQVISSQVVTTSRQQVAAAPTKEAIAAPAPAVSIENREWLVKQDQILQQQRESLENSQRDLKQAEEQRRIEQNRLVDEQHLLEPAQLTKGAELIRPARIESGKTSQVKVEEQGLKGGSPFKQEREEQKLEPLVEQQQFEQQTEQQQILTQRPEGAEAEPYSFGYSIDGQSRGETGDKNGVVRGYYRLASGDGQDRLVEYIADAQGFRAVVKTNEFGTEARSPAHVALHSSQPLAEELARSSVVVVQEQKQTKSAPVAPLQAIVQSPIPVEHAPIPLPVKLQHLAPPPLIQQVREESKSAHIEQPQRQEQQTEADEQVQIVKANSELRQGKSLEFVRSPSFERGFSSATDHKPIHNSPASHRSAKAEVQRSPPSAPSSYSQEESHNAGFEHATEK